MARPLKTGSSNINKLSGFFSNNWIELISGALMLIGIILSFFFLHIGGILVGLAFSIAFYPELKEYFALLRSRYKSGVFKTLMLIGTFLYFLLAIPGFILGAVLGFIIVYFIKKAINKYPL